MLGGAARKKIVRKEIEMPTKQIQSITLKHGDVTVDQHGRVVITHPELAQAIKEQTAVAPSPGAYVNLGCDKEKGCWLDVGCRG
jgi:hypothetical protein